MGGGKVIGERVGDKEGERAGGGRESRGGRGGAGGEEWKQEGRVRVGRVE